VGKGNLSLTSPLPTITSQTISSLPAAQQALAPSSNQIIAGTDNNNTILGKFKVFTASTDQNGNGTIIWPDLKPQSFYQVYITAAAPITYNPPLAWPNGQVITFNFSTFANPNLGGTASQQASIEGFRNINPTLADAMSRFVAATKLKSATSGNAQSGSNSAS
jgi:hypothetical protein